MLPYTLAVQHLQSHTRNASSNHFELGKDHCTKWVNELVQGKNVEIKSMSRGNSKALTYPYGGAYNNLEKEREKEREESILN